jgi:hypothetical protein
MEDTVNRFLSLALGCGLVALVSGGCSGTAPAGGISDPDGGVLANSPAGNTDDGGTKPPASGGSDVNADGVPQACERYLSCLLVESPSAYAGAIALYGHNAACWATPQQTANCIKACDASFSDIATKCECTGSTCKAAPSTPATPSEPEGEKKCAPTCKVDADCQNSCPAIPSGVQCCDIQSNLCFGANGPVCR